MNHCGGGNFKRLLKRADKVEARVAVILGDNELHKGTVMIKDLKTTQQEEVVRSEAAAKIAALVAAD